MSGRVVVDLGGACPGHDDDIVAIRRDDRGARLSACVPRGALEGLVQPAADLVDRKLIGARPEEIIDLKLASGATTIAMARAAGQWHQQTPVDRILEADLVKAFLDRLLDVSATKLVAGDPKALGLGLGLDPPRATVRIVSLAASTTADGGDAERTETLDIGADHDGIVHLRRVEDGVIAEISAASAEALLPSDVALRPRKIYSEPFARFRSLRITSPTRTQRIDRIADGSWAFAEPKGAGLHPDANMLSELADAVGNLTAARWVGPARPEHGLEHPRLVIEVALDATDAAHDAGKPPGSASPARTIKVSLGAPAGGSGTFARAGDDPTVFVVTRRIDDAAEPWLLDRTALVTEASRIRRVTLDAPGAKRLVLEATGDALHVAGAPSDPVANARAAAIREALGDLVAEGAASLGKPAPDQGLDKPTLEVVIELDKQTVKLRFGAGDTWKGTRVVYARREGIDATFAVAQARVRALLEAVGK